MYWRPRIFIITAENELYRTQTVVLVKLFWDHLITTWTSSSKLPIRMAITTENLSSPPSQMTSAILSQRKGTLTLIPLNLSVHWVIWSFRCIRLIGPTYHGAAHLSFVFNLNVSIKAIDKRCCCHVILEMNRNVERGQRRFWVSFINLDCTIIPYNIVVTTLGFWARGSMGWKVKKTRINRVICALCCLRICILQLIYVILRLTHLAHTRLAHGLSGGELRRVSIGLSLLNDPGVLILDEPTSGLDSASAFNVIQTLRSVADSRHRTVILSIHQPSFKILSTIDRILLLSKGAVVHHGAVSSLEGFLLSKGKTVPQQLNALEYAMEILNQIQDIEPKPKTSSPPPPPLPPPPSEITTSSSIRYKSSRVHEILTLYTRFCKIIFRTKQLLLTNTLEALVVGLVLGTIYINIGFDKNGIEKRLGLFAFTLTFLLSSTTETLPIFLNERPILLRETSSGVYRLSSYLIANTLVFIPYLLAIAVLYSVSVYFLVGLCSTWLAFAYFVLVIWVIVLMANSFVLFLSSFAPNYIAGTSLLTILLGCFFLFSGYFISTENLPKYWLFMHYLSMYKYALDALLINEYSCLVSKCLIWFDENKTCMVSGRDVLEKRGLHGGQRWKNISILIGFLVFYRVLWWLVLIRRVSRSKK
ncbi:hypothetical protein RHSIM_Rhsim03G0195400 [Rhododendron simsii]|uniref:ABC transporter domain-containing protein n=1 Tax=Rhododendron simsii TaxID=118357 RepID=A0A834H771_RHOSS|nr:hypothetical protein RHSIM_Rhsim03G0195400 [Rhododendron simsii]